MNRATLETVTRLHYGKALGTYVEKNDEDHPIRVFGTNGPIGWCKQPLVKEAGIVIGRKGAYRGVHFAPEPFWVIDTAYHLSTDKNCIDLKWLYYKLLTIDINRLDSGSAIPSTKREDFYSQAIEFPRLSLQKKIAEILQTYDDLIENNRRRMALLEEAARQLYREWFVRLRFPGHEHTRIANDVPVGWEKSCVSDFYDTASGGTPSRKITEHFTGEIPWIKTQELPNGFITCTDEKITEEALGKSAAKLFPERTVLIALYGATVGELGILAMPAATNQACCAVIPKDVRAHFVHSYLFFRENKEKLVSLSAGAAQKNISQQIVRTLQMVMPPKLLMDAFVDGLIPTFDLWLNLQRSNQKLRAARDLLLPRLMNGDIAV